ncbi:hypothetical protein K8S19_10795 [bacterium]|nr:hypothetical protein [bacterium]
MKIKGSIITGIRELIREKNLEEKVLAVCDSRMEKIYLRTMEVSWVPVQDAGDFFTLCAKVLFPGDALGIRKLGIENGKRHFDGGIYKIIFKVINVEVVIKKSASLWRRFHQKGICEVSCTKDNVGIMCVRDYPELPEAVRMGAGGEALGVAQLTTKRPVTMKEDFCDPDAWKWIFSW